MMNIILSIIIVTLLGVVASLKTKLNITENNLNSWRQTAIDLNNTLNH